MYKRQVVYDAHTTLKGVMEKEDQGNWEFVVPQKLKELYKSCLLYTSSTPGFLPSPADIALSPLHYL